jgi:predicted nucleotidyltransferase
MTNLPQSVSELVDVLVAMRGTVAVVLGGSRAQNRHDEGSDWDLGVYYRGAIDLTALTTRGTVFPPGSRKTRPRRGRGVHRDNVLVA